MNCYRHPSRPAIGACKACSKGVCHECANDTKNGLACSDICVDEVKRVNRISELNLVMMEKYLRSRNGIPRIALHVIAGFILGAVIVRMFTY